MYLNQRKASGTSMPEMKKVSLSINKKIAESTSFIITTNKAPAQWAQMLDDEVLDSALLDRLLYRCEVISLAGMGYRMKNRKTIFS